MSKECACCHRILDESCFSANKRNSDGLHSYCKECNAMKAKLYNQSKGKAKVMAAIKKQKASGYFRFGHGAIVNMQKSAKKRGINFNLTEEQLKEWWQKTEDRCYYCGCDIRKFIINRDFVKNYGGDNPKILYIKQHVFNNPNYYKIETMTIDRMNSSLGYSVDNLAKACWICNSIKSNKYSVEEMMVIAPDIINEIKLEMERHNGRRG